MAPTSKTVDNTGKKQRRAWNATGHSNLEKKLVKSSSVSEDNILPEKETRRRNEVIYHNLQLVDGNVPPQNVVKGNLKRSRKSKNTLEKREKSKIAKPKKLKETKEAKKEAIAKKKAAKIAAKKAEEEETAEAEPEEKKEEEKKEEEPKADKMEVEQEEEKPKRKPRRSVGKKAEEEPKKPAESVVVTALKNLGCSLTKSVPRKFAKKALPPHIRKFLEYLPNKPLESKEHEVIVNKWGLTEPDPTKLGAFKNHKNSVVLGIGEGHLFTSLDEKADETGDFDIRLGFEVLYENGKVTEPEVVEGPFKMSQFLKGLAPKSE